MWVGDTTLRGMSLSGRLRVDTYNILSFLWYYGAMESTTSNVTRHCASLLYQDFLGCIFSTFSIRRGEQRPSSMSVSFQYSTTLKPVDSNIFMEIYIKNIYIFYYRGGLGMGWWNIICLVPFFFFLKKLFVS